MFTLALGVASNNALVGWYMQFIHDLIEQDPEFREKLRNATIWFFERLAEAARQAKV